MFMALFAVVFISITIIILFGCIKNFRTVVQKRILIIVLGDVGRSPRMQYHALSFAKEGFEVNIVGFDNSPLIQELQDEELVHVVPLSEPPVKPRLLPRLLFYLAKTIFLFLQLIIIVLWKTSKHSHILVQNPPAIPTLAAAWLLCLIRQSHFIIDWHNYGYTILSLTIGSKNPLVRFSKFYEGIFGRMAAYNICVTQTMKEDLKKRWNVTATTLYDRPPKRFKSVDENARHTIFLKLSESYDVFKSVKNENTTETRFTTTVSGRTTLIPDRPALLISSTSWTEDEDFSILFEALQQYDKMTEASKLPNLVCVITGKGPLKAYYQDIISKTDFDHVEICTPWLEAEDYPTLVGSADLGICLHTSSSGLDLPMKVVDMFGCGVPVCAIGFSCLHELVKHDENGLVFHGPEQLAEHLQELLAGFPRNQSSLDKFRENLKNFQEKRWHPCWKETFFDRVFTKK
ncbi:chitobiosyldiphosphodolichol beta-mannosyltransferase-like [Dendronephthya gigantea]|uniref:chitobiosyldiphosphodolichol beta-mannosyltransferase-like n=1 Tax=Dendronephthya gigantea TaxID=151771 RepID=UPI00106CBCFF|nr:chitobiosyldiphosphodolichol beta-mannosyltransferase-like [Dendronephthya gigantea]